MCIFITYFLTHLVVFLHQSPRGRCLSFITQRLPDSSKFAQLLSILQKNTLQSCSQKLDSASFLAEKQQKPLPSG